MQLSIWGRCITKAMVWLKTWWRQGGFGQMQPNRSTFEAAARPSWVRLAMPSATSAWLSISVNLLFMKTLFASKLNKTSCFLLRTLFGGAGLLWAGSLLCALSEFMHWLQESCLSLISVIEIEFTLSLSCSQPTHGTLPFWRRAFSWPSACMCFCVYNIKNWPIHGAHL